MNFIKFNTIDLDLCDKEFANRVIQKISMCNDLIQIQLKPSSFKGYHVLMLCGKDCDICRLCYDDQKRFMVDLNIRKSEFTNLLWDSKTPLKDNEIFKRWNNAITKTTLC